MGASSNCHDSLTLQPQICSVKYTTFFGFLTGCYTTIAAGYKGVTWYTYFGDYYPYAPISKLDAKTPTWVALQAVNNQVATLAPTLSRLTSTGVYFSSPAIVNDLPLLPGNTVASVNCPNPVMVGEFEGEKGGHFAMIVNLSLTSSAPVTLKTVRADKPISIISAMDGAVSPFDNKAGVWLPPGQGMLLVVGN